MTRNQTYMMNITGILAAWSLAITALLLCLHDPAGVWKPKVKAHLTKPVELKPIQTAKLSKSAKAVLAAKCPDQNDWACVLEAAQ